MAAPPLEIAFEEGTLLVRGDPRGALDGLPECLPDARARALRLPACRYRELVLRLRERGVPYEDRARGYGELALELAVARSPLAHQAEGLAAWAAAERRGVVVLPTGAGKTWLGVLAIQQAARSALVVAPTLELVTQWARELEAAFGWGGERPVGVIGGGSWEVADLTVATYASAHRHMARLGSRFGLLIFDECHHLPGPEYSFAARAAIAPFRLGLSATPERPDGAHQRLDELVGPCVYRKGIEELVGNVLAPYQVRTIEVDLEPGERREYEEARRVYKAFLELRRISVGNPVGWKRFLVEAGRSAEGRAAFAAWRRQKELARQARAKMEALDKILDDHAGERTILFTADNRTVYEISRRWLVPALTHQTPVPERRELLAAFASGELPVLATSQVLNEGVDVPEAGVGVVISGTGSVREHVQRLGRLLRARAGKQAVLYEILSRDTSERWTSERRRDHAAYRRAGGGA